MAAEMTRRSLLGSALAGAVAAPLGARTSQNGHAAPEELVLQLEAEVDRLAREEDFQGVVRLARGGEPLLHKAWGHADRGNLVPNRIDTRFDIASVGKLFTSLAVMRLVASGKLALDQTLASAWPDYPNPQAGAATIAQLLSHSAGLGNHHSLMPAYTGPPLLTNHDYFRLIAQEPLQQPPGQGFAYSNSGYVVLALLLERITDEPFFDHVRRTIWQPLGMADTGPLRMDFAQPRLARGYIRAPGAPGQWQLNLDPRMPIGTAFGGVVSTAADLGRFGQAMAAGALLPPRWMAEWSRGRFPYHRGSYGLGCSEVVIEGKRIIGHSGGHPGVVAELMVWPELGLDLSIVANTEPDCYFALVAFAKQATLGTDDISRNHDFTRSVVQAFLAGGAQQATSLLARKPEGVRLGQGLVDLLANRELHRGNIKAGLGLLRFNVESFPQSPDPLWSLAEALRHNGERAAATAAYREYLARVPDDADALRWIGILEGSGE
ncbi:MAG: serine hydrolase [Erythrobacter sp.]